EVGHHLSELPLRVHRPYELRLAELRDDLEAGPAPGLAELPAEIAAGFGSRGCAVRVGHLRAGQCLATLLRLRQLLREVAAGPRECREALQLCFDAGVLDP